MISQRLQKMLIEQVGAELSAHQLYMGMSIYFERESLSRWAKLFRSQAVEEADHTSFEFVQWFIEEQVEEERKAQGLIDLIDSGINLFQAEPLLDSFE